SKGCTDTVKKIIDVYDKPSLQLAFRDTLICAKDTLQLQSTAFTGNAVTLQWSPPVSISSVNIPDPMVYPNTTTTYRITASDNSCINTDSVTVGVVPF